jgi:RNA polymerase sigma-B factor
VQAGAIGLINAIDRFDLQRGGNLAAFAVPTIQGEIKRHVRDRASTLRLPRDLQELEGKLARTQAEVEARTGRTASAAELARELEVDAAKVEHALARAPAGRVSPLAAEEELGNGLLGALDERLLLADAFHSLDEQERRVLYLRFVRDLECAEAARQLGVSERTLSRQTEKALAKLRDELESQPAAGARMPAAAAADPEREPAPERKTAPARPRGSAMTGGPRPARSSAPGCPEAPDPLSLDETPLVLIPFAPKTPPSCGRRSRGRSSAGGGCRGPAASGRRPWG